MNKIQVLDKGFVKLLNISGVSPTEDIDRTPAQCARISFDNFEKERTLEQDLKLAKYLIDNNHSSPLEMVEIWLEFKLPIFVARQFMRHRTFVFNEVSGRYATLPEEWYIPEVVGGKSKSVKQGQENTLSEEEQESFKIALAGFCSEAYIEYKYWIDAGIAPEHARMFLHLNHYTHYVAKVNLSNLQHFLDLRLHHHAQVEARQYANAVNTILSQAIPELTKLYADRREKKALVETLKLEELQNLTSSKVNLDKAIKASQETQSKWNKLWERFQR